ncbi:MAG: amino acid adenylation domain-containing protein, partial [Acidobacteriota bacterium]
KPIERETPLPLAFAQQRLWFLDQLEPNKSFYNIAIGLRLNGDLNVMALQQSLGDIMKRHEILRTRFATVNGEPVQIISPPQDFSLSLLDLSRLEENECETEAHRLANEEANRPFDLQKGPLVRASLFNLSNQEHVLVLSIHHIVFDGWSVGILIKEVTALYQAYCRSNSSPLAELPIQYADFAYWQREWLQGEELDRQLSYWKQRLNDATDFLNLPVDRPRPSVQTFNGAQQQFFLTKQLSENLKQLSRQENVTLFMTLLAAFYSLLYRYTGQEAICVGTPIANRNRREIEELIGFFVNTLVLRVEIRSNTSFQELIKQCREVALGAYANQDLPFERLVDELCPERDLSRTPLFQVMFMLQNMPVGELQLEGLTLRRMDIEVTTAKYDLDLTMVDTEEGLVGVINHNTDLFEASTISRMQDHFKALLEAIVTDPEQCVLELSLLNTAERQQILVSWNETSILYPKDKNITQLFEEQVERTPEAVALIYEDKQLSYRELNNRANQLAHYLISLGVGPEILVGICVERSLEMVVSILGVLKAGGAYLPLDSNYPLARLAFMFEDSQAKMLLTQAWLLDRLPKAELVVCLGSSWDTISQKSEENPSKQASADNLAYVIYTSGSTGRPKGVMLPHRGLSNLIEAQKRTFGSLLGKRVLQFSSMSFDASIFELAMALMGGATLCLAKQESLLPGPPLIKLLDEQAINNVTLPPSVLAAMPVDELPELETVITAGEVCSTNIVARWSVGHKLFNAYGPTETTIWATIAKCVNNDQKPTIGSPISNAKIYILDKNQQPVPIGVSGELYIGGDGLARGYLNRAELTADRFIPNPYSSEAGKRLYRTG